MAVATPGRAEMSASVEAVKQPQKEPVSVVERFQQRKEADSQIAKQLDGALPPGADATDRQEFQQTTQELSGLTTATEAKLYMPSDEGFEQQANLDKVVSTVAERNSIKAPNSESNNTDVDAVHVDKAGYEKDSTEKLKRVIRFIAYRNKLGPVYEQFGNKIVQELTRNQANSKEPKNYMLTSEQKSVARLLDTVSKYQERHTVDDNAINGWVNKLLPAIERNDPQIEPLLSNVKTWSLPPSARSYSHEYFGMADLICRSYGMEINPQNLNESQMILRELPTTSLGKLEQNRVDAILLEGRGGFPIRDMIHDQHANAHNLLTGMVAFYEAGDNAILSQALVKAGFSGSADWDYQFFDKANYDREFTIKKDGAETKVKAIDIVRRLAENTKPVEDAPPQTTDQAFNQKMNTLKDHVSTQNLGVAVEHINSTLLAMMKNNEIGIEPNVVLAVGWLQQKGSDVMRGLSFEQQTAAYSQEWFKQVIMFQELTASTQPFNESGFNAFIDKLRAPSLETESVTNKSKMVLERTGTRVSALARRYREAGQDERAGSIWSGNIDHELMKAATDRKAESVQGEKLTQEIAKRRVIPSYHPGD